MAMRWLTREWQTGALPEAEHATRWQAYLEHRDATAIHLPPALHRLAVVGVDAALTLREAIPDWWAVERGKAFTLAVVTGEDGDTGGQPQRIVLQYGGNLELSGDAAAIDAWLSAPGARLLYDEIEVLPGRRFEQRFLLAPDGELTVRFDNVLLLSAPTTADARRALLARGNGAGALAGASSPHETQPPGTGAEAEPSPVPTSAPQAVDRPEGAPSPVPAHVAAGRQSLRELLFGWLPGVRGSRSS